MSADLRDEIARVLADRGPHRWDWLHEAARDRYRADAEAVLAVVGKAAEPCKKCGYAGGCMEPWAAVSLDDPGDKVLIPCGTCPACLGAPGGES